MELKSMRTAIKITDVGMFIQSVFGNLALLDLFIEQDDDVVNDILKREDLRSHEKVKLIAETKKVSTRQAQRIKKEMEA